jgi:integrase/recombinase XerC/integrase/recombinase XerD
MTELEETKVRAKVWVTPEQVEAMRTAAYQGGADYLQQRNETLVAFIYDTGLRVGEAVQVDVDHLREGRTAVYLPGHIQKDYPNDNTPKAKLVGLDDDTTRVLSAYLGSRWKDTDALFPSRSSDRITTQGVRDVVRQLAERAEVRPYHRDGSRGEAGDVTPHALRHGVAYRMMNAEEGNTLYDVRNRLRHRSIQTTERVYDHIIQV